VAERCALLAFPLYVTLTCSLYDNACNLRRRFACLPGSRLAAFETDKEREAVKVLASRRQWGDTINDTVVMFLDRLWGDNLDVSASSFGLTPWNQVCPRPPPLPPRPSP
jgi:hypothetical protein